MDRPIIKFILPLALALLGAISFGSCLVVDNPFTGLPPGPWRGVLELAPQTIASSPQAKPLSDDGQMAFQEVTEGVLPFNFELKYANEQDFFIELTNGEERIRIDDIKIGRDRSTAKDTVVITFPEGRSYIRAIFEEDVLEGEWVADKLQARKIHFVAWHGQAHRFTTLRKPPLMDLSGRWEALFGAGADDSYPAVGEFRQEGNRLLGSFQTETGAYRNLEGTVQANKLYLSTFDGEQALLFEGKIQEDSSLIGSFRSGKDYKVLWQARRNPGFQLPESGKNSPAGK